MIRFIKILSNLLATGFLLFMMPAAAQQVSDTITLQGIEVTGAGVLHKITVERNSIELSMLPDAGSILRSIPGVNGIKKGGSAIDPLIRGFRFSQVAVIADNGLKVEGGCPNRMDPVTSHIESDDIEQIEVIKGPYTLKYGPSLGGIIRLNTFKPRPYAKFEVHTRLHTSVSSNPAGFNQYVLVHGGGGKVYFGLSESYKKYGDYTDGSGNTISSAFSKYNVSGDIGFVPHAGHEAVISIHKNYGRDIRFPALPMDEVKDNSALMSADYHIKFSNKSLQKLDLKIYNSDVYHEMDNSLRPAYSQVVPPYKGLMQSVARVNAFNRGGRCEAGLVFGNHELNAGFDTEMAGKDGGRETTMIMTMNGLETTSRKTVNLWQDAVAFNTGLFGEYKLNLQRFSLHGSARVDYNLANSADTFKLVKNSITYFGDTRSAYLNISVNAGISRAFGRSSLLSFFVGRGVRSPDLTERFIKFLVVGYDNYDYLGNPLLKPEVNYQSDIILNLNTQKAGKFSIDGYISMVDSYISAVILPSDAAMPKTMGALGVKQFANTGRVYFLGFESAYSSPLVKGFSADVTAAYTYGIHSNTSRNIFENGQPTGIQIIKNDAIQEIPPLEARLNLNYNFFNGRMLALAGMRCVANQDHVSLAYYEKSTPGFVLLNMEYRFAVSKKMQVSAAVNNLLDKTYYEHLNRRIIGSTEKLTEPGRNFYLNLVLNL